LGLSELYLNGKKVGDEVLSPALTDYCKRAMYVVHDVTPLVRQGRNAVGVWLGNGRYWAPRSPEPTRTFGPPKLRLILRIEYGDHSVQEIVSDQAWKITDQGPIRANDEYDGEEYDARKELAGWAEPGYGDADWKSVDLLPPPEGTLVTQPIAPIRVIETRRPIARTNPQPGVFVFDLGQNLAGWCRLRVAGPAGTIVRLRHAEYLQPDGMLEVRNLGIARCTDLYTLKGDGLEVYEPRFTYHGFRYVEVTGYPGEPADDALEACVVHDDLEPAGDFACSNDLLNRIHAACRWSLRGNYRSIPTDCPQRDERQGWLGDRATNVCGEAQLFHVAAFYEKWLTDIADSQRPDGSVASVCPAYWPFYQDNTTWSGAIALMPNDLWQQYDDGRFVTRHYPAMRAWVERMCQFIVDDRMPRDRYGDWCFPPDDLKVAHSKDPTRTTLGELIGTAYFQHILQLMSRYAAVAGRPADAPRYASLAERMERAFHQRFFNAASAEYDNGTQTSSLLPLSFGLTPAEEHVRVFLRLVEKIEGPWNSHLGTGLVGVQHLMRVLSDNGRPDLALRIATQPDFPSWGHMINQGGTTIWEIWNGDTAGPEENSRNHVMLIGDLLPWLYEYLAGIRPDPSAPGYRRIVLKPVFVAGLDSVRAWRETAAGRITSQWSRKDGAVEWAVSVPIGATATVYVPAKALADVVESNQPAAKAPGVKFLRQEKDAVVLEIGSGEYSFRIAK
jgi:alpha-L-rhamnosidase